MPDGLAKRMRQRILPACGLILFYAPDCRALSGMGSRDKSPSMSAVVAEIGRIGKTAEGTVGVAALPLETGRELSSMQTIPSRWPARLRWSCSSRVRKRAPGTRETVIADIARLVYDYFLISPP